MSDKITVENKQKSEYVDYFGEILPIQEALDRYYEVARELKQIFKDQNNGDKGK